MSKFVRIVGAAALLSLTLGLSAGADPLFRLTSVVTLPGKAPHWDYLSLDASRSNLFIGRRGAGVTVFSLLDKKVVGHIDHSEGANMATLIPEFDRGYTTNEDGTATVFRMSSLKTLDRIKLGNDADAAYYEPATKTLAFMRGDSHAITFVDARTAKVVGEMTTKSEELEAAAADGKGNLFVAERDLNAVLKVDARTRSVVAEWPVEGCEHPTGIALDAPDQRLFVGCRGDKPVLAVIDVTSGKTVVTLPIGHGNDGLAYDEVGRRVFTSNGLDSNLVIYHQDDADHYHLAQAVTTRPMARTMVFDNATATVYTVTAQGAVDPAKPVNEEAGPFYPNTYFDDTFTLLAFSQQAVPARSTPATKGKAKRHRHSRP